MQILDVALHTAAVEHFPPGNATLPRHLQDRVQISNDLWIGPLGELAGRVIRACYPRGENHPMPTPIFHSPYGFGRANAPVKRDYLNWDPDRRLTTCLALSRLVHPTSIAFDNAARVIERSGQPTEIVAAYVSQRGVYVAPEGRDWLIDSDIAELSTVLLAFQPKELPSRVKRALWYLEASFQTHTIDVRWTLVATGLEALIHTDDRKKTLGRRGPGSTAQFVTRLTRLCEYLPELAWSETELSDIYEERSGLAHGRGLSPDASDAGAPLSPEGARLYALAEEGLRLVLKRSILDPQISGLFGNDETVRERLGSPSAGSRIAPTDAAGSAGPGSSLASDASV